MSPPPLIARRLRRSRRVVRAAIAGVCLALAALVLLVRRTSGPLDPLSISMIFLGLVLFASGFLYLLGWSLLRLVFRRSLGGSPTPEVIRNLCAGCGRDSTADAPCSCGALPCRWEPSRSASIHAFLGLELLALGIGLTGIGFLDSEIPSGPILGSCFGFLGLGASLLGLVDRFGDSAATSPDFSSVEVPGGHLASPQIIASAWLEEGRVAWASGQTRASLAWPPSPAPAISAGQRAFFELLAAAEIRGLLALQPVRLRRWRRGADDRATGPGGYRDGAPGEGDLEDRIDLELSTTERTFSSDEGQAHASAVSLLSRFASRHRTAQRCLEVMGRRPSLGERVGEAAEHLRQGIDPDRLERESRRIAAAVAG